MRNDTGPLPALVTSVLVTAVLYTIIAQDWLVWIPVLIALAVTAHIWNKFGK